MGCSQSATGWFLTICTHIVSKGDVVKVLRILLLEDSLLDTELIQASLTDGEIDCELVRVETRADFIAALEKDSFELILSDYSLPSFDGLSALEISRTLRPEVPFIFVSATLGEELAIETLKSGATDYVLKQRLARLAPVVHRALREAKERLARQQAESALRESQKLFESFMNNSPITAFMKDEAGRYIYVNPTVERVFNRQLADFIGKTDFDLLPPETAKQIRDNDLAVLATGKATKMLETTPNQSGEQYWMSFKFPFKDASGRQLIAGMSVDITEQKRTEAALQASEANFRRLAESNVIGFIFWDVTGNISDANDAFLQMVGYTQEDLLTGKVRWEDMTPPEYRHLDQQAIEEMKTSGGAFTPFEKEYIRKDGSRVPILLGGTFLDESYIQGVSFVLDLSDRQRAEAERLRAEQQFRTLAENAPDIIVRFDREFRHIYVSPSIERATGRSPAAFIGKTNAELGTPEEIYASWHESMRQIFATSQERFFEFKLPTPTGTMRYYQTRMVPEFAQDGSIESLLGITRDITEFKQAEQALQKSEARFRHVFESKMIGMGFWDANGRVAEVNDAFLELVGYTREDFLSGAMCWQDLMLPECLAMDKRMGQKDLDVGVWTPYEKEYVCKDGSRIPVLIGGSCFTENADGGVFFALDLTERKKLENQLRQQAEELAQANRIKDEFLAVLSHELRSPLNPILGWAKLLRTRKVSEATTARALETIERNAQVQTQLIEDLLDVSRIMRGKISLNVCPVNLSSTIEAALETVRLAAEAKSIQIQSLLDPNVGLVSGDPNRLQQVVWNLLSNAVKFTPSGGRISIRLDHHNQHAQIQVCDTGKGISGDFLPYVFDYFRQADASTTRKHGGLGLGLAIVRHLVELHGGMTFVESPGEGQGSTFTVKLPLIVHCPSFIVHGKGESTINHPPSTMNEVQLNGLRVLVVDDEIDSREFLTVVLERCGAEVTPVASALEAIQALDKLQLDVMVSDIAMPEEDGYMLIQKVRARSPELGGRIPAAALTAYARAEDRTHALSVGFQMHLPKPIDPSELAVVVASLAGRIVRV